MHPRGIILNKKQEKNMFRKLVSNLAFSPALVGQLGFYAKRLKKEEATRRVGLIFTALALVVQSFAVFSPPEPANASSSADFITGGVSSLQGYLSNYDANTHNIKDLFTTLGITRANVAAAKPQQINSKGLYSWGLTPHFSAAQGEQAFTIKTSNGGTRTFYSRPLHLWDSGRNASTGSYYNTYVGKSSSGMWFALMKICGNLVLKVVPPKPKCPSNMTGTYPNCIVPPKMCTVPGKEKLPANSPDCKPSPVAQCDGLNITKLISSYQLNASGSASNGATIKGYKYVIKKDGKVVKTQTVTSAASSNTYIYSQTLKGSYSVEMTVLTSLGDKTGPNCVKTFAIPAPQMCPQNPSLPLSSPECQPCPGDTTIWIKDATCAASVIQTKSANNTTQGNVDATTTTAKAGDKIIYTLTSANHGKASSDTVVVEDLSDVSEYAEVIDPGSGTYDSVAKKLTWPSMTLKPGETQTRMFTVQVYDKIPEMGQGVSNHTSYDCTMTNTFGNSIDINVECPIQKVVVEQTVAELPHTGPRENMIFAGGLFSIVAFFYARSRQMKKEVRLIRRDLNAGTI
jgi:uncharacterized repeat protein (TIGR01451 family)